MPAIVVTCPHCGAVVPTLFGVAPGEDVTNAGFRGLAVACMRCGKTINVGDVDISYVDGVFKAIAAAQPSAAQIEARATSCGALVVALVDERASHEQEFDVVFVESVALGLLPKRGKNCRLGLGRRSEHGAKQRAQARRDLFKGVSGTFDESFGAESDLNRGSVHVCHGNHWRRPEIC